MPVAQFIIAVGNTARRPAFVLKVFRSCSNRDLRHVSENIGN
jgi:hypothetical protein